MNLRSATIAVLVGIAVTLALYDVFVAWRGSTGSTISEVTLAAARGYPIIALALGIILGHLFWPQKVG